MGIYILGIESSCDDTSAAILHEKRILSNIIANQELHSHFGGVVPELASRAHQQNIIPVIEYALQKANINKNKLSAVAFTRGPGLLGSLLVGVSFAKSFAYALNIPLIEVDHMQAHILVHFIEDDINQKIPKFPFLCLTVSGGHTQIVKVNAPLKMEVLGQTIDDASGEAFDKAAKILGLPYPGGPAIDQAAKMGNNKFSFSKPKIPNLDFSFSGLKTSFLYTIRDQLKTNPNFIKENLNDLASSIQKAIIDILLEKLILASQITGIKEIALAGGVSANSKLRKIFSQVAADKGWNLYLPKLQYTTDNAAMVAITGYFKYLDKDFTDISIAPYTKTTI
ncbi:MAG TPA: tRNA (adenosine(37)-N6)-threonylcarbamoyltransferase complex transferase subunit TsaD [Bacteroidales bacterium]|nr:tRNA (adenosine(37)-N6)-threonylcarbamoyltransferase complex transferase subunit TsaD [Bacteroidales bacterium]